MTYIISGCTLVDDIIYPDGRSVTGQLGGSIYTLTGIKPYTDDVLFVTTAGPDFEQFYGDYYRRNGLSTAGVQSVLPHTRHNILAYDADGRWRENSKHGFDFELTWGSVALIRAAYITAHASTSTRGIYLESAVREPVWRDLDAIRAAAPHAKIMWELQQSDCEAPSRHAAIRLLIQRVDVYSLNLPESLALFGTTSEAESLAAIIAIGIPCLFRVGTRGAYMIQDGQAWYAPAYDLEATIDATGCGNCATGAALYGYAEGLHPLRTVIQANLAATLNARQYGPFPAFTTELRAQLHDRVEAEFVRLQGVH